MLEAANRRTHVVVVVDHLAKAFLLPRDRSPTLKERLLRLLPPRGADRLDPIGGTPFAVPPGEILRIVGHNGSSKSTLLECLPEIFHTESGWSGCAAG